VVGGGVGGLTTAALLAARGVKVCLLERQSEAGGCIASFEKFGYTFENGAGLYALWKPGEIHDRIFAELPVAGPETKQLESGYLVRLPDHSQVAVNSDDEGFTANLRIAFPECAERAVAFYREAETIGEALLAALERVPDLRTTGTLKRVSAFGSGLLTAARIRGLLSHTTVQHLGQVSWRFRRFVDAQLQLFMQRSADESSYLQACAVLALRRRGLFGIRGGAAALATALSDSIRKSGGTIRLNSPALRLAYDSTGGVAGVQLLSGETLNASRAVVSNLTVWDTYGKLVGLDRRPLEVKKSLKSLRSRGAYLLFLGINEEQAQALPSDHLIAVTDLQEGQVYDPMTGQLTFAMAPAWDQRGPQGSRAATVHVATDVDEWFAYHEDESEHEERDQEALEATWARLRSALPELGDSAELIETATPRTFYENTRRKLGMVGSPGGWTDVSGLNYFGHRTCFPKLFLVGDTVFPGSGVAAVSHSALIVANEICGR
jgi:prolycopene isomerase